MVELELLERGESTVALLEQLEAASFLVVELTEVVGLRLGLADEGQRDEDDAADGQSGREHECDERQVLVAGMPTWYERVTSLRCSRASGQSVITEPSTNTMPATQIRLTRGFTKTRKYTVPLGSIWSAMTKRSSIRNQS